MIEIRKAGEADASLIADISRETFFETFAVYNTKADMDKFLAQQFSREMLMEQVIIPGNIFYLAFENNMAAGYVFLKEGSDAATGGTKPVEISRLYARTAFIGKGVGRSLMQAAIQYASANNNDVIWLGVWEKNQRAIDFYTAFGFVKFGEHDFILGDDVQRDWLMKRSVK